MNTEIAIKYLETLEKPLDMVEIFYKILRNDIPSITGIDNDYCLLEIGAQFIKDYSELKELIIQRYKDNAIKIVSNKTAPMSHLHDTMNRKKLDSMLHHLNNGYWQSIIWVFYNRKEHTFHNHNQYYISVLIDVSFLLGYKAIDHRQAKEILSAAWDKGYYFDLKYFLKTSNILEAPDIVDIINATIISENKAWKEYTEGNEKAIGRLIGAVMKQTNGKANPTDVSDVFKKLKHKN